MIKNARQKEYYNSHKEQCKGYVDPEKTRERGRRYRQRHPEVGRERTNRWRKNNPGKLRALKKQRRYRDCNAIGRFTLEEWNTKLEEYNYRCAYCGCELNSDTVTIDHQIPLSRGGTNYIENIAPACKICNCKKYTKTAEEYLSELESSI